MAPGETPGIHSPTPARRAAPNRSGPAHAVARRQSRGSRPAQPAEQRHYLVALVAVDLVAAVVGVAGGLSVRFGALTTPYTPMTHVNEVFAVTFPLVWLGIIALNGGYEYRFVGIGVIEFQRVFRAFLYVTVLVAFLVFVTKSPLSRGLVILTMPLALGFAVIGRAVLRKLLHRARAAGRYQTTVMAVGDEESIVEFARSLGEDPAAGLRVAGACVTVAPGESDAAVARLADRGIAAGGDVDAIVDSARGCGADMVVALSGRIAADRLRWIAWQLEGSDIDLVVSPGIVEVAGRRLHVQPVAGLPLLHVDVPEFTGFRRLVKSAFDRSVALAAMIVLFPLFATVALAVRWDSRGPALFRQLRVGLGGREFRLYKFRSMVSDAETRHHEVAKHNKHARGPMFKMHQDPRVTRVGRFIRRYSLDELPQLMNVVKGEMSLVGPRPPLPAEVAGYGNDVRRRLLVKPGITGLWQVSGRSDLTWEQSVRLDLRYVENWSLLTDLAILWRTVFAVVRGSGAY